MGFKNGEDSALSSGEFQSTGDAFIHIITYKVEDVR